jgi:hypothetical protein
VLGQCKECFCYYHLNNGEYDNILHLEVIHDKIPKSPMTSHNFNELLRNLNYLHIKHPRYDQRKHKHKNADEKPFNDIYRAKVQDEETVTTPPSCPIMKDLMIK